MLYIYGASICSVGYMYIYIYTYMGVYLLCSYVLSNFIILLTVAKPSVLPFCVIALVS